MRKAIAALKESDPVMAGLIERAGYRQIRYLEPGFETLVKSIVWQQLSGKAAATIYGRFKAAAGDGKLTPDSVLALTPDRMRALGLSRQKTAYIRDIARHTRSGEADFNALRRAPDDEVIEILTRLKGVGVWTAHMFLIFALRRKDIMPSGDLGVRAAIKKAYRLEQMPTPAEVEQLGEKWRPYRTIASWYLWLSLEPDPNL